MPQEVVRKYRSRFSKGGKIIHQAPLTVDTDYTILQRYQSVVRGIYNFYCMAVNVSLRMGKIKWVLETSLTKTLASKFRTSVARIYKKYQVTTLEGKILRVVLKRPDKEPLVAIFGGIAFERREKGYTGEDFRFEQEWLRPGGKRSEVVQRLLMGKCELCGTENVPLEVHHIRKMADLNRPGRRPRSDWERIMSARKRKTLVTCKECHDDIHTGQYDGPKFRKTN
jgi:hypothetical protein